MSKRRTHSPEFKAKVAMEAISGRREVMRIGSGRLDRVDQAALTIDTDVDFHAVGEAFRAAVVPLISLLGLVHLGISLFPLVLGGAGCRNDGGIDDGSLLHDHAIGFEVGLHGF